MLTVGGLVDHRDGDKMIGGLTDETTYYAIVGSDGTIQLASSSDDAANGVALDLGAADTNSLLSPQAGGKVSFDVADDVDAATDSISLEAGHGLETGDALTYSNGNGVDVAGLENGVTYYVITAADPDVDGTIQLAASLSDALNGVALDLGVTSTDGTSIDAGGSVTLTATDNSEINTIAIGVSATGGGAFGAAVSSNVNANTTATELGDTVLESDGALSLDSTSSAIVRTVAVGVSGSGGAAVQLTVLGNSIANDTSAAISGSTVTTSGDITLSAAEEAPSMVPLMDEIGDYVLDAETKDALEASLSGSPVDLDTNILSLNVSVAGTGGVAVNGAFTGNTITNSVSTEIDDSTVTSTGGDIILNSTSDAGILALTVGVAGSGAVAVDATGFGNVISNRLSSTIEDGSVVTTQAADGAIALSASDVSQIRSAGVSVAATGGVAGGALIGANVIANSVISEVSGSTVDSGSTLDLTATNDANILGLTVGVAASGIGSGLLSLSGNVVTNTTRAAISATKDEDGNVLQGSDVSAGGGITLSALDESEINSVAVGVSATGGGAVGAAVAANIITNTTETEVSDSGVETSGSLVLDADSSSIIRTLAVGVSGSGGFAVQVTALGNEINNDTSAIISDSTLAAAGDVQLTALEEAPSLVPDFLTELGDFITDSSMSDAIDDALDDTPIDSTANIMSLNVSVSGSGGAAINGAFTGNLITDNVITDIADSTVFSGAVKSATYDDSDGIDATDYDMTGSGNVELASLASSGILSGTIGVAAAAGFALDATGFGNVITNTVSATVSDGSDVAAGGCVALQAVDDSMIRSLGIGVAGSGTGAVSIVVGANVITNAVKAQIVASSVTSGSGSYEVRDADGDVIETLNNVGVYLSADADADILSFAGGVAATAVTGVQTTTVANTIVNTVMASIEEDESGNASSVDADGSVMISAVDSSTVDALGFGVAASGAGGAVGVVIAANVISNTIGTSIKGSTLDTESTLDMTAESSAIIRTLSFGVSATCDVSITATILGNSITNDVTSVIDDSIVNAGDDISLYAGDVAPSLVPDWLVPEGYVEDINAALTDSPIDLDTNILSLNIGVSGSGITALNGIFTGNLIDNTVATHLLDSVVRAGRAVDGTVTNATADIDLVTESKAGIISATVGVAATGGFALDASGFGNVITNTVTATAENAEVLAGGYVALDASDNSTIRSLGLGVAASGTGAVSILVGANVITNLIGAQVAGSSITAGSDSYDVLDANGAVIETLTGVGVYLNADSNADILSFAGGVAATGITGVQTTTVANTITNTVIATIADELTVREDGEFVKQSTLASNVDASGSILMTAVDSSTIDALGFGVAASGGGGAVGIVLAANVVSNTIGTAVKGSAVDSDATVEMSSESSAIIRTLSLGVSASSDVAFTASVLGNSITNTVASVIADSTVNAGDDVRLYAGDVAPSLIPDWLVPDKYDADLSDALADSPIDLDTNILSLNVSVSGSGTAAFAIIFTGNVIDNRIVAA